MSKSSAMELLPVAVVGGGPIGLAAAAHLIERGLPVQVYEAGDMVAQASRNGRMCAPSRHGAAASTLPRNAC